MRLIVLVVLILSFSTVEAQIIFPGSFIDMGYRGNMNIAHLSDSALNKKWSVSKYSSISTSYTFFKGGSATIVAAPIGLQLNRKLNNNLYAFAGVSVAPAYVNFNQSFMTAGFNKTNAGNSFYQPNGLNVYSRAELGLQYVNDEKTFSISGSIGIERNSYPLYHYNSANNTRANQITTSNR